MGFPTGFLGFSSFFQVFLRFSYVFGSRTPRPCPCRQDPRRGRGAERRRLVAAAAGRGGGGGALGTSTAGFWDGWGFDMIVDI